MSGKKYDAAIVGGGVIGSAIAYYLARQGKRVILLENGRLASQASQAAAGMLAAQAEMDADDPLFELALASREMFPALALELKEYSGIDIGLQRKGLLKVAVNEAQAEELKRTVSLQIAAGNRADWLTGDEVRRQEKGLSGHVLGAASYQGDGQVNSAELSLAFAKSAAVLGAEIREYAEVKRIAAVNGRIEGVETGEGLIACDQAVLAAGVWSGDLLADIGIRLPLFPVKGEVFSVVHSVPLLTSVVFSHGCYLVPKQGGRLVVGATTREDAYDRKVTVDGLLELMNKAKLLLPGIAGCEWEKAWAGLRPQTFDGLPYLGRIDGPEGLYIAAGHFRNGILLSPITGSLIAEMMAGRGEEDDRLLSFRPNRFDKIEGRDGERNCGLM